MIRSYIKHISYYLPEEVLTNQDLVRNFPEWNVEKIASKIGIEQRHIAADDETAGDMAFKAALKLFAEYDVSPQMVDFVLLCTQSPDYFLPTTACLLQDWLGIPTSAGALDFNLGCSGYIYGLALAKGLISGGMASNILLLTAETYSKYIHPQDKGNRSIFGDAATATWISTDGMAEIGDFSFGTDGKGVDNLIIRTGCSRCKEAANDFFTDEKGMVKSSDHFYMNGPEIFNFSFDAVPKLVQLTLEKNHRQKEDIDLFIFHQANKYMLSALRSICEIEDEKFYMNLRDIGNTVSNTIPLALKMAKDDGQLKKDMEVLVAGFGVGYSWGATLLKYAGE